MEQKWWHNSVVYQIYPRSFMDSNNDGIGDLQGIISKLDYLKNLGIDVIWLSPVYASPMDDNGYDISDYQKIASEFGTMEDMDQLLLEAKNRDIKIVMDLVVNHTSDEHPWFIEAQKSKDNKYRNYYIWRDAKDDGNLPNDLTSVFAGSAWEYDTTTEQYFFHLFSKRQPDLNWKNPKMIHDIYSMMNWWLDKGISGFRMDVIDLIGKDIDNKITGNGPTLHALLKEMNQKTFGDHDVLTVGETWGATPEIAKLFSDPQRNELSMVFQFEHITLSWDEKFGKWKPTPFNMSDLKNVFNKWQTQLDSEGWNSLFWNNHDLPRIVSKYGDPTTYRIESAKMLATMLHLQKGTPYIYQGEEIGMTNVAFNSINDYNDIETLNFYKQYVDKEFTKDELMDAIHKNSRDNARTPLQWNDSLNAGFTKGNPWLKVNPNYKEINIADALNNTNSVFYHYKTLIQLRKNYPVIVYGDFKLVDTDNDFIFAFTRTLDQMQFLIINNFTHKKVVFTDNLDFKIGHLLLSNYKTSMKTITKKDIISLSLEPYESLVYELKL